MSTLSKFVFDPLKALFTGNDNALSQLGNAQSTLDAVVKTIVQKGVAAAMAVLPGEYGMKAEILTDIIDGLQTELTAMQAADLNDPVAKSS